MGEIMHIEVTENHLKLLRNMNVEWNDMEYGAPSVNPKRPYGNAYVPRDIANILGWRSDKDGDLTPEQEDLAWEIHQELQVVLQACLSTLRFETGFYEKQEEYDDTSWVKKDP
jgi:hypothetical protein